MQVIDRPDDVLVLDFYRSDTVKSNDQDTKTKTAVLIDTDMPGDIWRELVDWYDCDKDC